MLQIRIVLPIHHLGLN